MPSNCAWASPAPTFQRSRARLELEHTHRFQERETMTLPRFLQIHTPHNYPGALLNRDDAGLAKRLPYGDKVRTR
ncbi:type I-E CRISPR-associated protein Cas7/Cse4/CasC, partial [Raoultella sp. 18098]|uniref:type I-E CRISPR-associated protein Cas7/Cse4/CasC n=1 Tax=Raoultella sp. 18098 TaxID=2681430 RepID=UPI0034CFE675